MPIYEYECEGHGTFEVLRSLSEYAAPAYCPACEREATRVISSPNLSALPRSEVIARDRNERSRHEPRVSSTPDGGAELGRGHKHTAACRHDHGAKQRRPAPGKLTAYTGARPWVIEHGG